MEHFAGEVGVLAVLASVALAGAPGARASEETPRTAAPCLRLVWIDVLRSAPYAFPRAAREASAILAGAGVETAWTLGDSSTVTTADELKIVLMPGATKGARLPEHVMGGTRSGAPSHTTWIYLSNVLWALHLEDRVGRSLSGQEEEQVARAVGRVVAHEIVHAVAPDVPHSARGLMAERLGRASLIREPATLAPSERRALRAAAEAFGSSTESAPAAVALAAGSPRGREPGVGYFSPSTRYSSDSERLKP